MKKYIILILNILILTFVKAQEIGVGSLLFEPNLISTGLHEHSGFDISPTNDIALWTISLNGHKIILQSIKTNNKWTKPTVASFSGQYRDEYHFFSPDGNTVYFNSYRPENEKDSIKSKFLHWKVKRDGDNWEQPKRNFSWHPDLWAYSMSNSETVYGWAGIDTSKRDADIYIQKKINDKYSDPIRLSDNINTDAIEYCPFIDPEEKYILFGRMGTGENNGLYISFKQENGEWEKAKRLSTEINKGFAERFPKVSPDGKVLFFNRQVASYKVFSESKLNYTQIMEKYVHNPSNGNGDIYCVQMHNILKLEEE